METLLRDLGLFGPSTREGLSLFKKKKKPKKDSDDTCPEATADQIDAVYQSQLDNYSSIITELNGNITDLSSKLAQSEFNYNNAESICNDKLNNQKNDYLKQLTNQKKNYEAQIKDLNDKLNTALKTITTDENIIKVDKEKISILREELRLAQMNRDKCIKEAIAAGKRFGFKNATVESNVYRSEIDGLF